MSAPIPTARGKAHAAWLGGLCTAAACLLALLSACTADAPPPPAAPLPPARQVNTLRINDTDRSYILRLPPTYDGKTKTPMVMLLNGANDSAKYAEEAYHFAEKADAGNFALVLPDALGDYHAWNALGNGDAASADVAFLTTLLQTLPQKYAIDPHRLYVCGHSVGAIMTYRMAAEHSDLIAAAGIVAGTVGLQDSLPTPALPVPLIIFHGRQDTIIDYGDPLPQGLAHPDVNNVAGAILFWSRANACDTSPAKTDRPVPTVQRDVFLSRRGADIVLYSLDNGNHMWPGGKVMPGKDMIPVQDISATDLMWDFFKEHTR